VERALEAYPNLDGVFCTNDDIAIGTLLSAQRRQIPVPQQLAVVGYNALDIGQTISPTLTSVDTPRFGEVVEETIVDMGYKITQGESV